MINRTAYIRNSNGGCLKISYNTPLAGRTHQAKSEKQPLFEIALKYLHIDTLTHLHIGLISGIHTAFFAFGTGLVLAGLKFGVTKVIGKG